MPERTRSCPKATTCPVHYVTPSDTMPAYQMRHMAEECRKMLRKPTHVDRAYWRCCANQMEARADEKERAMKEVHL